MALPAGRYGVTKNQLLKIKKLPMNTIKLIDEKADNSVIGTVEDGANPTKSYVVGEHMIRGGKFCTVTVAVTTSSTWSLGSNYVEGTIADNLVKQATFSGMTNTNGNLQLQIPTGAKIISVQMTTESTIALLFNVSNYYFVHVTTTSLTSKADTNVSGTYYYI